MRSLLFAFVLFVACNVQAQSAAPDSTAFAATTKEASKMDSLKKQFLAHAVYPLLKQSKYSGVIPVENPTEKPDPNKHYNLLLEVITGIKDSNEAKDVTEGLAEAGRVINLHYAAGVPLKNLHAVLVVHGGALDGLLKNEAYRKKYKIDNPNLAYINELEQLGVPIIACGQAMFMHNINRADLLPSIKVAYSAKTAMTSYQMKGYILHPNL